MNELRLRVGDIIATDMGVYQHFSIVTDQLCEAKLPMLISATKRNGTVKEEPWDVVTHGRTSYVTALKSELSPFELLHHARSQIDIWKYSITGQNCEHFVRWAGGINISSNQVKAGVVGAAAGAVIVTRCVENPKPFLFLGAMVALAGIAVVAVRASEKVNG